MDPASVNVSAFVAASGEGWTMTVADPDRLKHESWWFRQMLAGPYREASEGIVRVDAEDREELDWLRQLVDGRFTPNANDTDNYPESLPELLRLYLVAHKYYFEACVQDCRKAIIGAMHKSDLNAVTDVLVGIPEALYMDPEVQRVLRRAAKLHCTAWGYHEMHFLDKGEWTSARLADASVVDLSTPKPELLDLPPHVLAFVIRVRHAVHPEYHSMDNGLYTLIQGYVAQSPHCVGGGDETAALDAYRVLVEALLGPRCVLTQDFVCLVVSACPYALRSGLLPRIVAAGLLARLGPVRVIKHYTIDGRMDLDLSYLRHFKTGDRFHSWIGMHEGLHLILCVTRAALPAYQDVFAVTLLALCRGPPPKEGGPFHTSKRFVISGSSNGREGTGSAHALVCFEEEEAPAPRTLALLRQVMVNEAVGMASTAFWADVVREGSPYFYQDDGRMNIMIWC